MWGLPLIGFAISSPQKVIGLNPIVPMIIGSELVYIVDNTQDYWSWDCKIVSPLLQSFSPKSFGFSTEVLYCWWDNINAEFFHSPHDSKTHCQPNIWISDLSREDYKGRRRRGMGHDFHMPCWKYAVGSKIWVGAPIPQSLVDLAVLALRPAAFHYHCLIILIWLKYC